MGRASQKSVKRSGGGYLRLSTDRETKGPGSWNEGGYLQLSMLETARAASKAREMADTTGEAAVPAAVPALETAAETTPEPQGRSSSGFPKGVTRIKKKGKPTGKYQARVYDSLETKEQRGLAWLLRNTGACRRGCRSGGSAAQGGYLALASAEANQHVQERREAAAKEACSFCGRERMQAAKDRLAAEDDHHPDPSFSRRDQGRRNARLLRRALG